MSRDNLLLNVTDCSQGTPTFDRTRRKQVHLGNVLFEMGQNELRSASFCMSDKKGTLDVLIEAGS